jgi:hypothetical protein
MVENLLFFQEHAVGTRFVVRLELFAVVISITFYYPTEPIHHP